MATPESLVKALAAGLVEALLATSEPKEKKTKPVVAKTEDINAAVARYLDEKIGEEQPMQQDLFTPPGLDIAEMTIRRVDEARARAAAMDADDDEVPPGMYDPNSPQRAPWASPTVNS